MDDSGITLLFNRSELVTIGGTAVELVGLGDLWARDAHPELAPMGEAPRPPGLCCPTIPIPRIW